MDYSEPILENFYTIVDYPCQNLQHVLSKVLLCPLVQIGPARLLYIYSPIQASMYHYPVLTSM